MALCIFHLLQFLVTFNGLQVSFVAKIVLGKSFCCFQSCQSDDKSISIVNAFQVISHIYPPDKYFSINLCLIAETMLFQLLQLSFVLLKRSCLLSRLLI